MEWIENYRIISTRDDIPSHLDMGWQPFGSPFVFQGDLLQAMVKYQTA